VPHHLDEPNELAFVGGELGVPRCDGFAEEGDGPGTLVEYCAETRARRVALDDEIPVECGQLEHWRRREGLLQCLECARGGGVLS
jgi:hypothetical protein